MSARLVVRPGTIRIQGETVITVVARPTGGVSFPKGVPPLQTGPQKQMIFWSLKQWRKIEQIHRATPDDKLIFEGVEEWDADLTCYTFKAQSVKSTAAEKARQAGLRAAS